MVWSGIDKRRFRRVSFECVITVKKRGTSLVFQTHTENASGGGICVILEKELFKYTSVELELSLPDDFPPVRCQGTVVWSIKRAEYVQKKPSQYDTGIEFVDLFEEDKARIEHIVNELLEY
ncbi:MAG: hypothetical protein AMJ78_09245 [Omnitrophica WOR_2 bacterium SM23_29]|nr:MAG: hypothetical protein AMJ78_09245 [Omnitrophica WOR_2 bacterium SM23_29]